MNKFIKFLSISAFSTFVSISSSFAGGDMEVNCRNEAVGTQNIYSGPVFCSFLVNTPFGTENVFLQGFVEPTTRSVFVLDGIGASSVGPVRGRCEADVPFFGTEDITE